MSLTLSCFGGEQGDETEGQESVQDKGGRDTET